MLQRLLVGSLLFIATTTSASERDFQRVRVYRVTVTNLTRAQVFSPPVIATHRSSVRFFELGAPASDELAQMAENGNGVPLATHLSTLREVFEAISTTTPIGPGASESFEIHSRSHFDRISVGGMLVNSNDAFFAIDARSLPRRRGQTRTLTAIGYDAGSEFNSEDCAFIPGPACGTGSQEHDPGEPEGYVYVSNGIHGLSPVMLPSNRYDWHNPVARVKVQRIR